MNHYDRIKDSVDFIEKNLLSQLSGKMISENVYLSEYYFYRLFKRVTGYSLMNYIQKRRLSYGAYQWVKNKKNITLVEISLMLGFQSHSAFSRAFKKTFTFTPSSYYLEFQKKEYEIFPPFSFWGKTFECSSKVYNKEYEKVLLPTQILIGSHVNTTFRKKKNFTDIYILTEKVNSLWNNADKERINLGKETGVAYHAHIDNYLPDNVTFTYFRGYEVEKLSYIPKGLEVKKISPGEFLCFHTISHEIEYEKTIDYIFGYVLPHENINPTEHEINLIEKFHYDKIIDGEYTNVDIYIPLKFK